jgi:hypothetical protein
VVVSQVLTELVRELAVIDKGSDLVRFHVGVGVSVVCAEGADLAYAALR